MATPTEKLGLKNKEYKLKIGKSFKKTSKGFHSIRYDFKPASIDLSKEADVSIGDGNNVSIKFTNVPGSSEPFNMFQGHQRPAQKDCVLLVNKRTGEVRLEHFASSIQVKRKRPQGSTKASVNPTRPLTPIQMIGPGGLKKPKKKKKQTPLAATTATATASSATSTPTPTPPAAPPAMSKPMAQSNHQVMAASRLSAGQDASPLGSSGGLGVSGHRSGLNSSLCNIEALSDTSGTSSSSSSSDSEAGGSSDSDSDDAGPGPGQQTSQEQSLFSHSGRSSYGGSGLLNEDLHMSESDDSDSDSGS